MAAAGDNIEVVATYLTQTLSHEYSVRKPAEDFLMGMEKQPKYSILLLQLADSDQVPMEVRLAAAINFKNFVKRNWRVVESDDKIPTEDRETVKKNIVGLMLKTPECIQLQLSDAITFIGREDFPTKWEGLIQEMVSHFKGGDFHKINGILRTAHSLTKRYRHEFKSQELWVEIKLVLDLFADPFSELFISTMALISQHSQNKQALQVLFNSILLICKVFFSLTSQEMPDHFAEAKLEPWMQHFNALITTTMPLIDTDDDEEAGPLELVKSQICEVVGMFAQKYDEDFSIYLPSFVQSIWNLLVSTDMRPKHDLLVSNALEFLGSVAERPTYKDLFGEESTMKSICENVIVPNMQFREADQDLFEDNPEEYLRRDLEGSDIGTRRHSACNLVRALCRYFEAPVTALFSSYITAMLEKYSADSSNNWKEKDAALYLIAAIATKSKTARQGITKTSNLVNVTDIFNSQCLPELQKPNLTEHPVIRADSIRFLTTFRSILPREVILTCLPVLTSHLTVPSHVVHTYAAHSLEKILVLKGADGKGTVTAEDLLPHMEFLLVNLFGIFKIHGSELNEYAMKAILRVMSTLQEKVAPYSETLLKELAGKLTVVSENPSKPHFNHYLFESICCIIRCSCKVDRGLVEKFEEKLFPIVENILVKDVSEFLPYVFQILSLLLELRPLPVPELYMVIYPLLLTPSLWERNGNVPALVRLLQAFIQKAPAGVTKEKRLEALLGVFQKLIASKLNDHEGFYLMGTMIECLDPSLLSKHIKDIFTVLFQRLQKSKTTKYVKGLLVFMSLFAGKYGGSSLLTTVEAIQPRLFLMVIERLYLSNVQKVSGQTERRICAIGITKILAETSEMLTEPFIQQWTPLLQALISLFELPEDDTIPDDEHFIEIDDTPGYQTAFSQLVFAGIKDSDPFKDLVPNPKANLAQSLHNLSVKHPGKLQAMIQTGLSSEATQVLQSYLQLANISTLM